MFAEKVLSVNSACVSFEYLLVMDILYISYRLQCYATAKGVEDDKTKETLRRISCNYLLCIGMTRCRAYAQQ